MQIGSEIIALAVEYILEERGYMYCIFVHTIVFPLYEPWIQTENLFTISDTVVDTNFLDVHVRSAPEPIDEKKEISQNLLKTPIRSDYFTLEIIEKDRSFNYLK